MHGTIKSEAEVVGDWVNVGTAGFSAGGVNSTSLALDSSNTPYVAYMDVAYGYQATVMKYDGGK